MLRYFFTLTYVLLLWLLLKFIDFDALHSISATVYALASAMVYAALYLLVPILVASILNLLIGRLKKPPAFVNSILYSLVYLMAILPVIAIHSDLAIYKLYAYHIDGFVWNLMTTSGGIAALGATSSTKLSVVLSIAYLLITLASMLYLSLFLARKCSRRYSDSTILILFLSLFFCAFISEEACRGYAKHVQRSDLQQAGSYVPFALETSLTDLFNAVGIKEVHEKTRFMPKGQVDYPHAEIELSDNNVHRPNIIILAAESFRWDLLDPEITPHLWSLAKDSTNFQKHYSGGNRTRMGMFSMFYGLYAPYWFLFEETKTPPVLMDVVQDLGYQIQLNTSQSFDYPEFRTTMFAGMPEALLHEIKEGNGPSWERDSRNIEVIQKQISQRDSKKPFFNFMFFESTHAPYNFPDSAIIRPDFIKNVDYMKIEALKSIERLHNRYINAAHHIDNEVGRLLSFLKDENLMDDTIILFTGDHGEEFMENGHWGHGHNDMFPEYQIRVPCILYLPGQLPREIATETNHLQIPASLMQILGVKNKYQDYAMAPSLFEPKPDYFILGNYNYATLVDEAYKITFPFTGKDYFHYNVFHANNDALVKKEEALNVIDVYEPILEEVDAKLHLFCHKSPL